jgi:hypothetical protein
MHNNQSFSGSLLFKTIGRMRIHIQQKSFLFGTSIYVVTALFPQVYTSRFEVTATEKFLLNYLLNNFIGKNSKAIPQVFTNL